MEATVVSVQPNVTKQGRSGPYTVHVFTYQPDPYKGQSKPHTTRDVLNTLPVAASVLSLQPGQRIALDFQPGRNPNFKDLVGVQVIGGQQTQEQQPAYHQDAAPNQQQYQAPAQQSGEDKPKKDYASERDAKDAARQASIQRQTCLKAAVEIVKELVGREGYYPKKIKQDLLVDEVTFFADKFEGYILKLNDPFVPDQGMPTTGFPEPQYNADDEVPY